MPGVPYLTDNQIRQAAEDLLHQYDTELIPVPIEEIVEIHLGLEIIPFRAYKQRFSADGSISTDLTNITVDEGGMDRYRSRYRFTLAHEVGHLLLHRDYIQSLAHEELADWKASLLSTTPTDRSRMEYQARKFTLTAQISNPAPTTVPVTHLAFESVSRPMRTATFRIVTYNAVTSERSG